MKFLNKIRIKWPEIKFADNRIDRVHGRIISLINSIITIKFIKNLGELSGTKCLKVFIGKLKIEQIINFNHIESDIDKLNIRCLVDVKI